MHHDQLGARLKHAGGCWTPSHTRAMPSILVSEPWRKHSCCHNNFREAFINPCWTFITLLSRFAVKSYWPFVIFLHKTKILLGMVTLIFVYAFWIYNSKMAFFKNQLAFLWVVDALANQQQCNIIEASLTLFPLGFVTWYTITVIKKDPCLVGIGLNQF